MTTAQQNDPEHDGSAAVGIPVDCRVGRLDPERADSDAPICPWCDRQGRDACQHYDDTRTCTQAWGAQ